MPAPAKLMARPHRSALDTAKKGPMGSRITVRLMTRATAITASTPAAPPAPTCPPRPPASSRRAWRQRGQPSRMHVTATVGPAEAPQPGEEGPHEQRRLQPLAEEDQESGGERHQRPALGGSLAEHAVELPRVTLDRRRVTAADRR